MIVWHGDAPQLLAIEQPVVADRNVGRSEFPSDDNFQILLLRMTMFIATASYFSFNTVLKARWWEQFIFIQHSGNGGWRDLGMVRECLALFKISHIQIPI
jgi:hypothetical protein